MITLPSYVPTAFLMLQLISHVPNVHETYYIFATLKIDCGIIHLVIFWFVYDGKEIYVIYITIYDPYLSNKEQFLHTILTCYHYRVHCCTNFKNPFNTDLFVSQLDHDTIVSMFNWPAVTSLWDLSLLPRETSQKDIKKIRYIPQPSFLPAFIPTDIHIISTILSRAYSTIHKYGYRTLANLYTYIPTYMSSHHQSCELFTVWDKYGYR